jgi:hypothetical protein
MYETKRKKTVMQRYEQEKQKKEHDADKIPDPSQQP